MIVTDVEQLQALHQPDPAPASVVKQVDHVTPAYAALIAAPCSAVLEGRVSRLDYDAAWPARAAASPW